MKLIEVQTGIYERNDELAAQLREQLHQRGMKVINLLGTPGSGKTTMLEQLLQRLPKEQVAVIEGDLYTDTDARRIAQLGVQTLQLNTKGACHLEAAMIAQAVEQLQLDGVRYLIIDNIGNLVCTAEFQIGEDVRVALVSATEGNDKPVKYPLMFQTANVVVLNKTDLLPYLQFDVQQFWQDVRAINPDAVLIEACATQGKGVEEILQAAF
jgi:hydrogenase nickel incorporation protein HypB